MHVPSPPVSFYLPKLTDAARFEGVDPDADWTPFRSARGQSIPHTYVRLRRAGHEVGLTARVPQEGIVVVFAGDMRRFRAEDPARDRLTVVCVQTDRRVPEVSYADVLVQHNGLREDGRRRFFIPNWPQPGLVPRDHARGTVVRTVTYKGDLANLHRDFLTPDWIGRLDDLGLRFRIDANVHERDPRLAQVRAGVDLGTAADWHDYRTTDLVLAVRPPRRDGYRHKPAVKLVNAWRAAVPALLGPERAFQELRRSQLDYLEVESSSTAASSLSCLTSDPSLYEEMVANGLERARDFTVESIIARWEALLFETLPRRPPRRLPQVTAAMTVPVRRATRGVRRRASHMAGGSA